MRTNGKNKIWGLVRARERDGVKRGVKRGYVAPLCQSDIFDRDVVVVNSNGGFLGFHPLS
jgi:hypothetical protein